MYIFLYISIYQISNNHTYSPQKVSFSCFILIFLLRLSFIFVCNKDISTIRKLSLELNRHLYVRWKFIVRNSPYGKSSLVLRCMWFWAFSLQWSVFHINLMFTSRCYIVIAQIYYTSMNLIRGNIIKHKSYSHLFYYFFIFVSQ